MMKTRNKVVIAIVLTAAIGGVAATSLSIAHDRGDGWRWSHDGGRDGHHRHKHGRKHDRHMYSKHGEHDGKRGDRRLRFEQLLQRFDSNSDGQLTQAEIDQAQIDRLDTFDNDKDGQLSLDEYAAQWLDSKHSRMVDQFQTLDEDGDAVVTAEEFKAPFARLAERLGRNAMDEKNRDGNRE